MDKYRNKKTEIRGRKFDSRREAARYAELVAMQRAGEIYGLDCHPSSMRSKMLAVAKLK